MAARQQNGINVAWSNTMTGKQAILRRCNIFGFENHFPSQVNALVIDCWFHGAVGPDCDMIELYGNPPNGGSRGIVARHNTFDGRDTNQDHSSMPASMSPMILDRRRIMCSTTMPSSRSDRRMIFATTNRTGQAFAVSLPPITVSIKAAAIGATR